MITVGLLKHSQDMLLDKKNRNYYMYQIRDNETFMRMFGDYFIEPDILLLSLLKLTQITAVVYVYLLSIFWLCILHFAFYTPPHLGQNKVS